MARSSKWLLLLMLVLPVCAASCAKKAENKTVSTHSSATAVAVTSVDLGRSIGGDRRVTDRADVFKPGDTIYASVLTSGVSPGSVLKARWTFEDGQVVDQSEQTIAPTGAAATEFHISKPEGWPSGKYKLEVFVDGTPAHTQEFVVKN